MIVSPPSDELSHVIGQRTAAVLFEQDGGAHGGVSGLVVADAVGPTLLPADDGEVEPVIDDGQLNRFCDFSYSAAWHSNPSKDARSAGVAHGSPAVVKPLIGKENLPCRILKTGVAS